MMSLVPLGKLQWLFQSPYQQTSPIELIPTNKLEAMLVDKEVLKDKNSQISYGNKDEHWSMKDNDNIHLSNEEMMRIDQPWSYSVIIKLMGKKMTHTYLKSRLTMLWKVSEDILLIDLEENMNKALHNGPWFINGFFLSIKRWQPNFVASTAKETYSTIWLRLPELLTEYYALKILATIGNKMGQLVKTDICTSSTPEGVMQGSVSKSIGTPVKRHINIG
ncbi:hypothetical protein R3W88_033092 [Solanum pinnatisectum]|uniref:DUF4283 domain-containing protein n=1 Tax=Solanum pinnatisectum TaxID=50273 RepID=A0AAV9K253_9SOLN|nr:hypothetical protein R3W88_033092 [Solanum pinnatisectum]